MFMIVRLASQELVEAVVLAARGNCLRAAVKGSADAVEYRFHSDHWLAEDGTPIQFEALLEPVRAGVRSHSRAQAMGAV